MVKQTETIKEVDQKTMDALLERIDHAIKHDLALSVDDMKLIILSIETLCTLQQKISSKDTTLHKLRKSLGMLLGKSERRQPANLASNDAGSPDDKDTGQDDEEDKIQPKTRKRRTSRNKKSRKNKKTFIQVQHYKITTYHKGQICEHCQKGKLYKHPPGQLLRVTGHSPYETKRHVTESLRCNACQTIERAKLPPEVLADGGPDQAYGYSARTLMVIQKFFSGLPYYHQSNLSDIFSNAISPSTIFDQCEHVANDIMPVFYELRKQASNAISYQVDDTKNRILEQKPELRQNRNGKGTRLRTGVYTSGLIATLDSGNEVILFETSLGHAGEHLDDILKHRDSDQPTPLLMGDALSANIPTVRDVKLSNCNAHCRREFIEIEKDHPESVGWFLDTYGLIWKNEDIVREKDFSNEERLDYHKKNSLPEMEKLKEWAEKEEKSEDFQEHSALGKAIKYFLKHYYKLIMFCLVLGALIDNNRMEEKLKIMIRSRMQSHFYKTVVGAQVANVLVSVLATTDHAGVNVYDYLIILQQNKDDVRAHPELWLPWNFEKQLEFQAEKLKQSKAA